MKMRHIALGFGLAALGLSGLAEDEAKLPPRAVSPQVTSNGVIFAYYDPDAFSVSVTGDFNQWSINSHLMERNANGVWVVTVPIKPGRHLYEFSVNGIYWKHDPNNPNRQVTRSGTYKSVVEVPETASSPPQVEIGTEAISKATFRFEEPLAKEVAVGGFFNRWDHTANPMTKNSNGVWTATVELKTGKHPYKIWVDGRWIPDPTNPSQVPDGYGGSNSVVNVIP